MLWYMPVNKPKKVGIAAKVDEVNLAKLKAAADADERTVSYMIDKLIAEWVRKSDGTAKKSAK